ncbi:low-density lipoprotein receptor-related protein 6-like [Acanthaster planci]|uniref:Low-density lipoprotein receptor-related protein 6-like n=1 Tax=Acanthaster planci TaxID=133434 RepID=A0A8B7ZMT2_ACAPL|nr:low-density lipoprotein receptor-related protein 6-like [Acanthaster planci]
MAWLWILVLVCCLRAQIRALPPELVFANRKDIRILNFGMSNDSDVATTESSIIIGNLEDAAAMDYLFSEQLIFWTDVSIEMIKRMRYNGSQIQEDVISTDVKAPDGLACDWVGRKIYWTNTETNRIEVSELNGQSRKVLYWQDLDQPRAIVVHPERGLLFWTDWGEIPKIERAGMDGSEHYRKVIIDTNIFWPNGLTLDYDTSKLYWADAKYSYIHRCNFDGGNREQVLQGSLPHPFALTLFEDTLYWTDWETHSIHACNKMDGGNLRVVHEDLFSPMDIHSYSPLRQKEVSRLCAVNNGGCSHLCLMSPDPPFYACACPTGVRLQSDRLTCANGAQEILILARRRDIRKISLDTPDYTDIIVPLEDIQHAVAIDYDPVEGFIYWTDNDVKAIRRAKLDGSASEYIVTSDIDHSEGIAIDWIARNLYWTVTGTDRIEVSRLNGTSRKVLISEGLDEPRAIAVDPMAGLIYWSDWGEIPKIEKANLDGTGRSVLINTSISWPNGIAIDHQEGKIYWGDGKEDRIEVVDMDGSNRRVLVDNEIPHIFGFSLLGDYIYWTDWQRRTIERVNKHSGEDRQMIMETSDVMGLTASSVREVQGHNPCGTNNGGCSHLCFYLPPSIICSCPIGYELLADQRTCIIPEAFLLFSLASDIRRISLETNHNDVEIPLTGVKEAGALDFDINDNRIYWSDMDAKTISRAFLNGSGIENVIEFGLSFPEGMAIDWVAHNIYFSDTGTDRIEVARLDGSARRVLVWERVQSPRSIALHPSEGYMYWSDFSGQAQIERAYMDGTHRSVIYRGGRANGLTIDYLERRLYWTSLDTNTIESADLLGGSRRRVIPDDLPHPFGLTQYQDYIYWADWETQSIERANKTNGLNRTLIQDGLEYVLDILVFHSSRQSGWNECAVNNGGCQFLCLSHPNVTTGEWDYVCQCPTHYTLNEDGQTCTPPDRFLLFSQKNTISRMAVDYRNSPDVVLPIYNSRKNIRAIEYDAQEKRVYWINTRANTVRRSYDNGVQPEVFIPNSGDPPVYNPYDLAIDPYTRMMFWTCSETNTIRITRLDGTPIGVVKGDDNQKPRAIALIPEKGLMFWTNVVRTQHKIERASYDGTEHTVLFSVNLGELGPITADPSSETLFWVDTMLKRIESAHISGSDRRTLVEDHILLPKGLAVLGDHLYWVDRQAEIIARVNKYSGSGWVRIQGETSYLTDIQAVGMPLQADHPCIDDNGGCSHICIAMGDGQSRCSCPLDLVLQEDESTCGDPPTCSTKEFTCVSDSNLCVPLSWRCDSDFDCDDHSDEEDCPFCKPNEFRCDNGQCIDMVLRCNSKNDCSDDSDEQYCTAPCRANQYECVNKQCVDVENPTCDGVRHCYDGSDEKNCDENPQETPTINKPPEMSGAVIGSIVALIFVIFIIIGLIIIFRHCRCGTAQGGMAGRGAVDNGQYSTVLMVNQLGGRDSSSKYLSGSARCSNLKSTNLHSCANGKSGSSSSCGGLFERAHPTGASSCSSEMSVSGNSNYPKETLNPPPSPVTDRSQCMADLYYPPQNPSTSRSYRHYKMRNIPPPPTPCSTDFCEDSEPYVKTPHHQKHHATRRKRGNKYYTNVTNFDVAYEPEPYPPPPTPIMSDNNYESCPPSPSTERSFFNPYPPPPSPATDST